jgi:hypothetical protein
MYSMYTIKPDHITKQSRIRHTYYENSEDIEPMWLKYVYSVCLFSMVVLFVVIIV